MDNEWNVVFGQYVEYSMCWKNIETETVSNKREMNNE